MSESEVLSSEIAISPNPTNGIVTVQNTPENTLRVSILNILGESVLEVENPHSAPFSIDLSSQPSGIYFACFVSVGAKTTKVIVKN